MTEILLLGTFHFMESERDFYSTETQGELERLVEKLMLFNPNAVAVEAARSAQSDLNQAYNRFDLMDLQNKNLMKEKTLGNIEMFGSSSPLSYQNETVQIGFRMAKMLKHSRVYAVDNDMELPDDILSQMPQSALDVIGALQLYEKPYSDGTLAEHYRCCNSDEWSRLNHDMYMQMNTVNTDDNYVGAVMNAKWYERNLKIFCNIQELALEKKRIFVVFGAGHLKILRDFINADSHLKLIDVNEYL